MVDPNAVGPNAVDPNIVGPNIVGPNAVEVGADGSKEGDPCRQATYMVGPLAKYGVKK